MVLFNYSTKEITAKIVYYGPGLCGKTTNLQFIYDNMPKSIQRGRMLSLATKTDRTLFFDFLPLDLGKIRDMKTRVQLYTVPGQVFYDSTRKVVLKGADGIVFVADSQTTMKDANLESFANLEDNCAEAGIDIAELPLVLQFNKRDLPEIDSLEQMNEVLNKYNAPFYESVATTGIGVHETLKGITKLVIRSLQQRHMGPEADAKTQAEQASVAVQSQVAPVAAAPEMPQPVEPIAPPIAVPPPIPMPPPFAAAPPVAASVSPASEPQPAPPLFPEAGPVAVEAEMPDLEPAPALGGIDLMQDAESQPPAIADVEPAVVEGLLRLADQAPQTATVSFDDLTNEFEDGTTTFPASPPASDVVEGAVAVTNQKASTIGVSSVSLEDCDPLGLQSPAGGRLAPAAAMPVIVKPGQEEVLIPLEIRSAGGVQRYRLRLNISLGRDE